jgi:hypothetical protein
MATPVENVLRATIGSEGFMEQRVSLREVKSLSPAQEAALERLLSQSHHLGGRAPSRNELHER